MDWRSKRGRERVRPSTPLSVVRSINFFSPVKVAWCVIFQKSLDRFPRVFPLAAPGRNERPVERNERKNRGVSIRDTREEDTIRVTSGWRNSRERETRTR